MRAQPPGTMEQINGWWSDQANPRKKRVKRRKLEEEAQVSVIQWAECTRIPTAPDIELGARVSDYLIAIPNGGSRNKIEAANLKRSGVKKGVSDLLLPIARKGFHGLWIEMKAGDNKPTTEQKDWLSRMDLAGYQVYICYSAASAQAVIMKYLN